MYKALKEAKKLITYEQELLSNEEGRTDLRKRGKQSPIRVNWKPISCWMRPAASKPYKIPGAKKGENLDSALAYNRRLWTLFMTSVTNNDNPLPTDFVRTSPTSGCSSANTRWQFWPIRARKASAR